MPLPEDPFQYYPPINNSVFQVVSFLQVFPPKLCIQLSYHLTCYTTRASLSFLFDHPNNIFWGVLLNSSLYVFLNSPFTSSHTDPNILKHPQPTFLPQCEISALTSFVLCSLCCKSHIISVTLFLPFLLAFFPWVLSFNSACREALFIIHI